MKITRLNNKRAQEEIVGFVLIILLVSVIALVFLGITLRKTPSVETSAKLDNFMQSMLSYTSSCSKVTEYGYYDIDSLIKGCYKGQDCLNREDMCIVLEDLTEDILDNSFGVSEDKPTSYYSLNIYYQSNISDNSNIEPIKKIEKGECIGSKKGARQIISALPGNIQVELEVCTKK